MNNSKKRLVPFLLSNLFIVAICIVVFIILLSQTISLFTSKTGSSFPKTMFVPHMSLLLLFLVSQLLSLVIEIKMFKREGLLEFYRKSAKKICLVNIISSITLLLACFFYISIFLLKITILSIRVTSLFDLSIIVLLTIVLLIYPVICFVVFLKNTKPQQTND